MTRVIYILFLFLLTNPTILYTQTSHTREFLQDLQDADTYFYFHQDFYRAASIYDQLLADNPGHHNLSAKLAICYINIEKYRSKAVPLLRIASENVAANSTRYTEYGEEAPAETLYYLAYSLQVNDSLKQAVEIYNDILKQPSLVQEIGRTFIEAQINACILAMEIRGKGYQMEKELFSAILDEYPGARNPAISANDSVFIFSLRDDANNVRVFCSYRDGEKWQKPSDITSQLGNFEEIIPNSVTADGTFLVLYAFNGREGSLFYSQRDGNQWDRARRFPRSISSKYWEAHGWISPNGETLYFSSNRPGGYGELDIYVSQRTARGGWSDPVNAGKTVNSAYNETTPFFDTERTALIFSSERPGGTGGYSYFSSRLLDNDKWGLPELLPYPLNRSYDNLFLVIAPKNGKYVAARYSDELGDVNIYSMTLLTPTDATAKTITASVLPGDGNPLNPELLKVTLHTNDVPPETIITEEDNQLSFSLKLPSGNNMITISHPGYVTDSVFLSGDLSGHDGEFHKEIVLTPEKVGSGEFLMIRSIHFGFDLNQLTDEAVEELDRITNIISGGDSLTLEITGFTDAVGHQDYNKALALRRAEAVANHLRRRTPPSIIIKTRAVGAAGFVALNVNPDGTDNPLGRQYNRRVTVGVVNPGTGLTITPDINPPRHLRHPESERFGIVVAATSEKLYPDYFHGLGSEKMLFVRPFAQDSLFLYILGDFAGRSSAASYLQEVKRAGFSESYIISMYEVASDPLAIKESKLHTTPGTASLPLYTIQLFAGRKLTDTSMFQGIEYSVLEGNDNLFRYITGEFKGFTAARKELRRISEMGFSDAFIRDYRDLMRYTKSVIR